MKKLTGAVLVANTGMAGTMMVGHLMSRKLKKNFNMCWDDEFSDTQEELKKLVWRYTFYAVGVKKANNAILALNEEDRAKYDNFAINLGISMIPDLD